MSKFVKVVKKSEIDDQSATMVEVEGKELALFKIGGEFYAIDNTCTHAGGPLSEGMIEDDEVECPWHGATFNIKTGQVLCPPAPTNVSSYNVRVTDEDVEIEVQS